MTPDQLRRKREDLLAHGISLAAFCREKNLSYYAAYDVLRGVSQGLYGAGHRAAVALGLKPDPATLKARRKETP